MTPTVQGLIWLECRISRGPFSGERLVSLDLGGITLFAVTPTCYLRDVNGSMILENFPEPKHQVRGYVRVNTHMIGDGNVEVHLPDMQSNYKVVTSIESVLSISCARTLF